MKISLILSFACTLFLIACDGDDDSRTRVNYHVPLSGRQEVPMVETSQTAAATISINLEELILDARLDLRQVENVTAAHIHRAEVGVNGPVAVAFTDDDEDGIWRIDDILLEDSQYEALLAGLWYVNVHTTEYPNGELRGQVLSTSQRIAIVRLEGEQEVPSVDTTNYGQAYLFYDSHDSSITLNAWAYGFEASAAHIHMAQAGRNGDVIVPLEANTNINGLWQSADNAMLTSQETSALFAAELYVNIHSPDNPSGEVRGQILPKAYALMIFDITPEQEVPQVSSPATGKGYATLDKHSGGLRLNAWAYDIDVTVAHVHQAPIGVNGDPIITLEENTEHSGLWQTPENTALDTATQALFLAAGHYVNMHSESYPDGEIRGQIVSQQTQVLAFTLNGQQQVPPVSTDASGEAYALVNSENGALSLTINTENLASATAAHLHRGNPGSNGEVVATLERDLTNDNRWRLPLGGRLDADVINNFLHGGYYVDLISPLHANGEIRGQVLSDAMTFFPLSLEGSRVVPPLETNATGSGAFTLNASTGSLRGALTTNNIAGIEAHIHHAPAGENGPVILDLESTENGYQIPENTTLSAEQVNTMLDGVYYVDVSSAAYNEGEIRSQITPMSQ